MRKYMFVAILGLLVAAVLVAVQMRSAPTVSVEAVINAPTANDGQTQAAPAALAPAGAQATSPTALANSLPTSTDPAFQDWIRAQAKTMDQPSVDGEMTKQEVSRVVKKLTPPQSRQLLQTARNPEAPAGEKILSTYLLVQAGPRALRELRELITSPLEDTGPRDPHTLGEAQAVREKTLRIMALDGLSSRAQTDPNARATLAASIDEIQDPYVKAYARERYRRLPAQ